jgi:hypothetical protein
MNLKGIGVGNGWMDAKKQEGPVVIDYAYWHDMIDSTSNKDTLHAIWEYCIAGAPMDTPFHDFNIPDKRNLMGVMLATTGTGIFPNRGPNTYDVTTYFDHIWGNHNAVRSNTYHGPLSISPDKEAS